jgi:hypothetical protein
MLARMVFDSMTLGDALSLSEPDQIEVRTPDEQLFVFKAWEVEESKLCLFYRIHEDDGNDQIGDMYFDIDEEVSVSGEGVVLKAKDYHISFLKLLPFDFPGLLSSKKPEWG